VLCIIRVVFQGVYWVGPFIGGVVAAIVYRIVQFINKRADKLKAIEEAAQQQLQLNAPDLRSTTF
jgi:hypothetical protein